MLDDLDNGGLADICWDGTTKAQTFSEEQEGLRQNLADCAKGYDWPKVLALLTANPQLVNTTRPGGHSWYSPLHQAAHGGATLDVVSAILRLGAWRTLRNSVGKRPLDIALERSHVHLLQILTPVTMQSVPTEVLSRIECNFHNVIRERVARLIDEHGLRLPPLEPLLEFRLRKFWFAVPGMYGGFAYWLAYDGQNAKLIAESWCRIAGGSGQRHEITAADSRLVEEGFV